jgi:hypothetical protein
MHFFIIVLVSLYVGSLTEADLGPVTFTPATEVDTIAAVILVFFE